MYAYELHQMRSAELIRQAQEERLAREATRGRRAARREAVARASRTTPATGGAEPLNAAGASDSRRPRRLRPARST
ncbi:hypothetical protein [Streptomyces sp. A012304]|uniref:hypothetical protein n=1 Tax=Streptomyces sp. A012304 TaxID=375446 RepID=UPI00222E6DA6|nr:hypothetical protein [Streptomyces sp. A012304]GKQ41582.1 hypothetical protein ALMP_80960 [Streptomyces sp. A012304]